MTEVERLASHVRSIKRHIALPQFIGDCEKLDDAADLLLATTSNLEQLRVAIRAHRDMRGDDRCWRDDATLYAVLPEGYTPPVMDTAVELERCRQFIAMRQQPATVYVSPQRRIEDLESVLQLHMKLEPKIHEQLARLRTAFNALLLKEVQVFGGVPVPGGRLAEETAELREAIAVLLNP